MEPSSERKTSDIAISGNGAAAEPAAAPLYCGYCGGEVDRRAAPIERFGERFCSDSHADEFVKGVRAARVQTAATAEVAPAVTPDVQAQPGAAPKPWNWKHALKMAACCGAPLLALVLLAGGGGALLGAAGAALPLLLALACPLAMFFMMRGMMKGGQGNKPDGGDVEK